MMSAILTIAEAARLIAAKKLSPVELAKTHLDRIGRLDPDLNAFLLVTEDRALADAKAAEARQMSGALRGKLDGIPIAHKDIYNTAGIRTTAHSKQLEHNVPTRDAHTVGKWADADTVMLLHRPEMYEPGQHEGTTEVIIGKQRNGPTGEITLAYIKQYMRYDDFQPGTPFDGS